MRIRASYKRELQRSILQWFNGSQRDLPWRKTKDPYKIWISEIMLQQTQVKTVESYYNRFVRRFPDIRSLSNASLGEVMKVWEGLGYYSRARNLHQAAQIIVNQFNGKFPDTLEQLTSLSGIGRYTAGALLSIAFNQRIPVLDGNVIRVFTRIFHITENIQRSDTKRRLWILAEELLPQAHVGDFNQGLMELGAILCKPKQPVCELCPLSQLCRAKQLGIQDQLPVKPMRKPIPHYDVVAGIIWKGHRFLITLRPPRGLLGGLWEFPGGKVEEGEIPQQGLKREVAEELGIQITVNSRFTSVKHAYTHFKITLHVFHCRYQRGKIQLHGCDDYRWILPSQLDDFAFPGADRKVIRKLLKETKEV
jgi:A/G-specific adenine glycosylase